MEPGACAEPAQVPRGGVQVAALAHTGTGPDTARVGSWGGTKQGDQGQTETWGTERAEGVGEAETDTEGTGKEQTPAWTCQPARPRPPRGWPTHRVPGYKLTRYAAKHKCGNGGEQGSGQSRPGPARLPPCRWGRSLAWVTRPAEQPGWLLRPGRSWEQVTRESLRPGQPPCSPDHAASAPSEPRPASPASLGGGSPSVPSSLQGSARRRSAE